MSDNGISAHLKVTGIIYGVLIFMMIVFFATALFVVENNKFETIQSIDEIFRLLIPLSGMAVMIFVRNIYNKKISTVNYNEDISSKIIKYRTFKIIQWALLESVGIFSIVGFVVTGNYLYAIVALFLLGFFVMIKPTKEQFFNDFNISKN